MANLLVAQLLYLDSVDQKKDITMYINSPGGSVTAGEAMGFHGLRVGKRVLDGVPRKVSQESREVPVTMQPPKSPLLILASGCTSGGIQRVGSMGHVWCAPTHVHVLLPCGCPLSRFLLGMKLPYDTVCATSPWISLLLLLQQAWPCSTRCATCGQT